MIVMSHIFMTDNGAMAQLQASLLPTTYLLALKLAMWTLLTQTVCTVCNMQVLTLGSNKIGDAGMQAFSSALADGALASCQYLNLGSNNIGDGGMEAFSGALATGAMAQLQVHSVPTALSPDSET